MTIYEQIIAAATGVTDVETINRIEDILRIEHSSLGSLSRRQIEREAKFAHETIKMIDAAQAKPQPAQCRY